MILNKDDLNLLMKTMWTLKRPEALLEYYDSTDYERILGYKINVCNWLESYDDKSTEIMIPYRFGMNLAQIGTEISKRETDNDIVEEDDIQVSFFLDRLEVFDPKENSLVLRVPEGILCKWFLHTTGNIESHRERLVFIDSCPHSWDGIDNVFLVTVGIIDNQWCQQSWGKAHFIKDCLRDHFCLDPDTIYSWGNDEVTLELTQDGMALDITSGFDGCHKCTVPCIWKGDRWVIDTSRLTKQ